MWNILRTYGWKKPPCFFWTERPYSPLRRKRDSPITPISPVYSNRNTASPHRLQKDTRMKRIIALASIIIVLLFISCTREKTASPVTEQQIVLRYAENQPALYPTTQAAFCSRSASRNGRTGELPSSSIPMRNSVMKSPYSSKWNLAQLISLGAPSLRFQSLDRR